MHKNTNSDVIKLLSKRSLKANKSRNTFAVIAIILTTMMIATVFSIGISYAKNFNTMQIRIAGTTASIFLKNPTPEQYNKIKNLDGLKAVGSEINIGMVTNKTTSDKESKISIKYYDDINFNNHYTPAISDINGKYPTEKNEVMLSQNALHQLGIENPSIGMKINLDYTTEKGEKSGEFILTGWFTSYEMGSTGNAFFSKTYCENEGLTIENSGIISISAKNQGAAYGTLKTEVSLNDNQEFESSFSSDSLTSNLQIIAVISLLALFIVFSGYLLIYNVIYISVSKDIRFYGMLKTIGTSPKQIRKLVKRQVFILAAIGIPIGILISSIISFAAVPFALKTFGFNSIGMGEAFDSSVSFSPVILIGAALFSFLTVLISCNKPSKQAGKISPVEALKKTDITISKKAKSKKGTNGGKIYKMAFSNVFRDKKRAILVFISLFMGTITFLSVNGVMKSMNADAYAERYIKHEFTYSCLTPIAHKFDDDFINKIKSLDGVNYFETVKTSRAAIKFDENTLTPILKQSYGTGKGTSPEGYSNFIKLMKTLADKGEYSTAICAIDEAYIEKYNKTHDKKIDLEAFKNGETVIIGYVNDNSLDDMLGKTLTLTDTETQNKKDVSVGGIFDFKDFPVRLANQRIVGCPEILLISRNFMESFNKNPVTTTIMMDTENGKAEEVESQLKELNKTLTDQSFSFESRTDIMADFESSMKSLEIMGSSISVMLLLIGILNFINVMLTGVFARKNELAVMESIGMTKKQIKRMLTFEGLYYALVTTGLIATIGNGILFYISKAVPSIADYAVFQYPFALLAILLVTIFAICLIVPMTVYSITAKESITDRLRNIEN